MNNQPQPKVVKVLRLLVYTGTMENIQKHLVNRGVKGTAPSNWNGGRVTIQESFMRDELGLFTDPLEVHVDGATIRAYPGI